MKRILALVVIAVFLASGPAMSQGFSGGGKKSYSSSAKSYGSSAKSYGNSGGRSYGAPGGSKSGSSSFSGGSSGSSYGNSSGTQSSAPQRPDASSSPQAKQGPSYGNSAGGSASGSASQGAGAGSRTTGGFSAGPPPKSSSKAALDEYKSRFAKAAPQNENYNANTNYRAYTSRIPRGEDVYRTRTVFYENQGWTPPPYMYQSRPSFGILDAMMLWFMLDHISQPRYSQMAYQMGNDPGFSQWREEANRLAADNADLRQKLADLDARTKEYADQGVQRQPGYVPEGVDPSLILSPDALQASQTREAPASGGSHWLLWVFIIAVGTLAATRFRARR